MTVTHLVNVAQYSSEKAATQCRYLFDLIHMSLFVRVTKCHTSYKHAYNFWIPFSRSASAIFNFQRYHCALNYSFCVILAISFCICTYRKTSHKSPGFYQYKRPPACMQGPAFIRGQACIITCQVCVILFKKIVNFHVYRIAVFCLFSR